MIGLVKLATPDKSLLTGNDEWNRKRVLEYLNKKKRFLELLMLAMFIMGGQSARGLELGSIKFRDSVLTRRNFFVIGGHGFYVTEYNKARACTNHSYFVVRYLPSEVTHLMLLYIAFIQPFCNLLHSQISLRKHKSDGDYLFCLEDSNDICWNGKQLSEVLQRESKARLHVQINLWAYRHIVIG